MDKEGLVFNIQRYSVHDGPGIRTCVFLKGCPLRCIWCSNPESQSKAPELAYIEPRCQRCGLCIQLCPRQAIKETGDGGKKVDPRLCDLCGRCVNECRSSAWRLYGKVMTTEQVIAEVVRDRRFYRKSGGGVTLTGGEPLMQSAFTLAVLGAACDEGIHTALETSGYGDWESLEQMTRYLDLVLFDVKHMDAKQHQWLTGRGNELILKNARRLARLGIPMVLRVPLIPGLNDSNENLLATGEFARSLEVDHVDVLPFHQFGESKYKYLGRRYGLQGRGALERDAAMRAQWLLTKFVPQVTIGGA